MSEDTKDSLDGLAGETLAPAPVVSVKDDIPETIDSLEPIRRKTDANVPIQLLEEVLSCPKEHVTVRCIVYPDNSQRTFTMTIRGDSMIPRYRSTHEGQIHHSEVQYKMPDMKIEAPVVLDAEGNKVVSPEVLERLAKARAGRKANPEFIGIPDTVNCTKCGEPKPLVKANVLKYAKADGKTVEDYLASYECPTCHPRKKGKQTNAKWALLPKELHCHAEGCTKVLAQHPSMTEKQATLAGKTFTEYCETWLCREHRPHKAHQFSKEAEELRLASGGEARHRGRKPNPLYIGIPKTTICTVCKKEVVLVASNILEKANILGITVDELIKNYKCKNCGGRLTKDAIQAYKKAQRKAARLAKG